MRLKDSLDLAIAKNLELTCNILKSPLGTASAIDTANGFLRAHSGLNKPRCRTEAQGGEGRV